MADGETEFLNDALAQVSAARIAGMDDGTVNANYCKTFWPPLRRSILRQHHWNFATMRVQLAQDVDPPLYEFAVSYALPSNYLKIVEFNGIELYTVPDNQLTTYKGVYRIEGLKLLTNDAPVYITYIGDVDNMALWDPMAYQGAASWLASKLATAIPKNVALAKAKLEEAMGLLGMATAVDGQEGTVLPFVSDSLTWGRR